jgi:hypothetical protein
MFQAATEAVLDTIVTFPTFAPGTAESRKNLDGLFSAVTSVLCITDS